MRSGWNQTTTLELRLKGQGAEGITLIHEAGWSGELYACGSVGIRGLHEAGAFDHLGAYVAVKGISVYSVGSSKALTEPYAEDGLQKRAIDRVVVLTSCDGSLMDVEIGYVESYLADKAGLGPLTIGAGMETSLDGARLRALGEYVERAMLIMSFMGIDFGAGRTGEMRTIPVDGGIRPERGARLGKPVAVQYLRAHGIHIGKAVNISTLSYDGAWFWINPRVNMLEQDWYIILNDNRSFELIALHIPPNTLRVKEEWERGSGVFLRRDKRELVDLHLDPVTLRDSRSGTNFSVFVIGRVGY